MKKKLFSMVILILVISMIASACGVGQSAPTTTPTIFESTTPSTEATVPSQPAKPSEPTVPEGSEPTEPLPTEPAPTEPIPSEPDMPSEPTECSHNYEAQVHNPTCTAEGYTVYTCTLCSDSYQADEKDPLGHAYSTWEITQQANCTQSGKKQHTCSRCDKSETKTISATGHQYEGKITTPASSCKDQGKKPSPAKAVALATTLPSREAITLYITAMIHATIAAVVMPTIMTTTWSSKLTMLNWTARLQCAVTPSN